MKNIHTLQLSLAVLLTLFTLSCKKKDPNNNNPGPTLAKYYFNFSQNGTAKTYRSNQLQTGHGFFENQLGGYILNGEVPLSEAMGITMYKSAGDSLSHSEVMAMQGQTYYYDDPNIMCEVFLDVMESGSMEYYYISDESNHAYKLTITSVVLTGSGDNGIKKYNIYEVKGTCSAKLEDATGTKTHTITNGDFYARFTKGID